MGAWKELFTSDVGLMSLGGLAIVLGMAVFYIVYFVRHVREDTERAGRD